MAAEAVTKARRMSFGTKGVRGLQPPFTTPVIRRGRNHIAIVSAANSTASTQKQRRVGQGPYSVSAPPTSKAAAKPPACAVIVSDAARLALWSLLNSRIAALEGPTDRPTPTPMKARPANTHQTSGATAKSTAPTKD